MRKSEACLHMALIYHPSSKSGLGIKKFLSNGYGYFWFKLLLLDCSGKPIGGNLTKYKDQIRLLCFYHVVHTCESRDDTKSSGFLVVMVVEKPLKIKVLDMIINGVKYNMLLNENNLLFKLEIQ